MIYVGPLMIIGTNVWNASYSTPSWRVMITGTLRVKKLEPHKICRASPRRRFWREFRKGERSVQIRENVSQDEKPNTYGGPKQRKATGTTA